MLGSISVRSICWRLALTSLIVALTIPVSGQANRANQAQARWYDAYQQAVSAVQRRDWPTAERLLLQALSSGTKPGPRVFAYGDTYIRFVPDYYLGVVYLNTNRAQEAEAAFARVRSQKIIAAKDPEYTAFERQGKEATFNRAFGEAQQLATKGDFTQANSRLDEARTTRIDDTKVTMLAREITQQMAKAQVPPPVNADSPVQAPVQQPATVAQTPPSTTAGGIPNNYTPPNASNTNAGVITAPRVNPTVPKAGVGRTPPDANKTFANQGVILARQTALRDGLLAFFSGDYGSAIPLLASAAQEPSASPRAQVFLACAKVGLVLTGGGDAAMLREARAAFQNADAQRNLSAADRRFISPRVLQQLETP